MNIAAFGCSFTWGLELDDPSTQSWPALLGATNLGQCAASNQTIVRTLLDYLVNHAPDLVVVMWTYPARFEFVIDNNNFVSTHINTTISLDGLPVPDYVDTFRETFFKTTACTDSAYVYTSLMAMHHAESVLKCQGIPYIFTRVADFDINSSCHVGLQRLYRAYAPDMTLFNGQSFEQYARSTGSWGKSHPLSRAHQDIATLLQQQITSITQ
jgi:hypothetical protein